VPPRRCGRPVRVDSKRSAPRLGRLHDVTDRCPSEFALMLRTGMSVWVAWADPQRGHAIRLQYAFFTGVTREWGVGDICKAARPGAKAHSEPRSLGAGHRPSLTPIPVATCAALRLPPFSNKRTASRLNSSLRYCVDTNT
jgi:hypothetical protein